MPLAGGGRKALILDRVPAGSAAGRHGVWALLRYRVWVMLHGRSLYVLAIGALVLVAALISDFLAYVTANGLAISQNPFQVPLTIVLNLAAIYLALLATVSISREREQGTLLVLSFGPLTSWGYLLSWLVAQAIAYFIFCVMLTAGLVGVVAISGLGFSTRLILFVAFSVPATAGIIAFGILAGSLGHDTRGSILVFLAVTLLLVGFEALNAFFATLKPEQLSQVLLPVSRTVSLVNTLLAWISPYGYLPRGLNAIYARDWPRFALTLAGVLVYTVALLLLARLSFERKGVQP